MTLYTIYKAINLVNNKIYIGVTSRKFLIRKEEHQIYAFIRSSPAYKHKFHCALRKHGLANFMWEEIYQSTNKESTINVMETYFIKEYNSHYLDGHGYNMTYGGQGNFGYKFTKEHRKKLSESQLGKVISAESRAKMKAADRTKQSKTWRLSHISGKTEIVTNLAKWARENGTRKQALLRVYYGKRSHWRGWKVEQLNSDLLPVVYSSPS